MLFGAIGFSYDNAAHVRRVFDRTGVHSANLGDNMQTLAVRHLYRRLGVPASRILRIDRDRLRSYAGPPAVLPMNAVFGAASLPLPPQITPVWIGFHADAETIRVHRDWLARQGTIGCRDPATAAALQAEGIAADVTGCLTFSLGERKAAPEADKGRVLMVFGSKAGALPAAVLKTMPDDLLARADFIVQRREMTVLPLQAADMDGNDRIAGQLLQRYRRQAALVVTPLHHAAAPAIASGIPTVVVRNEPSARFGFIEGLLPVHVGPDFSQVDWRPAAVDIAAVKAAQWRRFSAAMAPFVESSAA